MSTTIKQLDQYYPDSHRRFLSDTEDHAMTVLRDDGLYRHLMFRQPEHSWRYWFEIVTWPGCLTIRGDMGSFTFARTEDMFEFFAHSRYINPGYWAEKLVDQTRETAHRHDEESVRRQITEYWNEHKEDYTPDQQREIWEDLDMEVLGCTASSGDATYQALTDFATNGFEFTDIYEWDFKDWTTQYLWCCHAILHAIDTYRATTPSQEDVA